MTSSKSSKSNQIEKKKSLSDYEKLLSAMRLQSAASSSIKVSNEK